MIDYRLFFSALFLMAGVLLFVFGSRVQNLRIRSVLLRTTLVLMAFSGLIAGSLLL